jgi:PAS domain S-box-containing protein
VRDEDKSKEELIRELAELRKQFASLDSLKDSMRRIEEEMEIALEAATEEKSKSEGIISAIGDGISIQNRNFRVLYQNEIHKNIVGGDKKGEYCYKAYAFQNHVCPGCPVTLTFTDGRIHSMEKKTTGLTETKYIEIKASPLLDSSGNIVAGIEVVRDITERKRIEESLLESETRYRMLFESAGDAIFILDAEGDHSGRIVAANQAAAKMHDYTVQELTSMNIQDIDTEEAAREAPDRIRRMLNGEWIKAEITHQKKDGSIFPVEISAGLLGLGQHRYILAIDRDISDRKQAEQEREKLIKDLQAALDSIKTLRGLLPICAWCKKVRDDRGYWKKVEEYVEEHSEAMFTHGICPECFKKNDPELYDKVFGKKGEDRE